MSRIIGYFWDISQRIGDDVLTRTSDKPFTLPPPFATRLRMLWTVINVAYLLVGVGRFTAGLWLEKIGLGLDAWFYFDTAAYVHMYILKSINTGSMIAFAPLPIFCIVIDYQAHLKRFNYTMKVGYYLAFTNKEHFFALNPTFQLKIDWRQPLATFKQAKYLLQCFWYPSKQQLKRVRFKYQQFGHYYIDKGTRLRLVLYSLLLQAFVGFCYFLLVTGSAIIGSLIYLRLLVVYSQSNIGVILALPDTLLVIYNLISLTTFLLFGAQLFLCGQFRMHSSMSRLRRLLGKICREVKRGSQMSMVNLAIGLRSNVIQEHCLLLLHIIFQNSQIVSPLLFAAFLSHVSVNMYLISALYQLKMSIGMILGGLLILLIQLLAASFFVGPIIGLMRDLYSCTGMLYSTQTLLKSQNRLYLLQTKLKLLHYLDIVNAKEKIGFTAGPLGHVTSMALAEFLVFYTGNLFMILKYLRTEFH